MITADAQFFMLGTVDPQAQLTGSVELIDARNIFIGPNTRIGSGVVLDASDGPVVIDAGAVVMPQAVVIGPAYIGPHTRIKIAAKIYQNTSIGPWCKVGGEVEDSVFHSFANKQHDGFVGHSYFAPWTNLGADTNTSDLKNNYSSIRVTLEGREHDTGRMFLGTIMADHAKCGINTMFNTGTVVGVGCNLFGGDFPPKYLPHFTWGGAGGLQEYDFDRFCATASIVMQRRERQFSEHERRLCHDVFVDSAPQRHFAS
jgi:UDP-N-acetylglucosamine diphosphorylase/glucosamine-1-phosphate N-acetyltransferase